MAGLHHHRGNNAYQRVNQEPSQAGHRKLGQVQSCTEGFEALLHIADAQEDEPDTGENVTEALESLLLLKHSE